MEKEYFICSKAVVELFPECEKSNPIKTGYKYDEPVFVAVLDFKKVEAAYDSIHDEDDNGHCNGDFWCWSLVAGQMDVSKLTLKGIKERGLFLEIENKIGLTSTKNRAMTIHELAEKFGMNPIEFANSIAKP